MRQIVLWLGPRLIATVFGPLVAALERGALSAHTDKKREPPARTTAGQRPARDRGRSAGSPSEIPKVGWRDVALRVRDKIVRDNVALVSAGIAFYGLLALFPGVAVLVSLYGLVADPADIAAHIEAFPGLPEQAKQVLTRHLDGLAASSGTALSFGFVSALLFSIWSASRATKALLISTHIAYQEREERGFFRRNAIAMLVTTALLVAVTVGLLIIALLPIGLRYLGLPFIQTLAAQTLPWLVLLGGCMLGLSLLYRHGPQRSNPK